MPITAFLRPNKALSTNKILVTSIQVKGIPLTCDISKVLSFLKECQATYPNWLTHPIQSDTIKALGGDSPSKIASTSIVDINLSSFFSEFIDIEDDHDLPDSVKAQTIRLTPEIPTDIYYYLEPSRALNTLFAKYATLLQQIEYIELMGVTNTIERHPGLKSATKWHIFCKNLSKIGIINPPLTLNSANEFTSNIKRLHLVHPIFLLDDEISSGLHISILKNKTQNNVLYLDSPEMLELALSHCKPNSTLIIDGHWVHNARRTHGVWKNISASEMGVEINRLFLKFPNKINSIRLLGCESGYLSTIEALQKDFKPKKLRFKSETTPKFYEKPMAAFRDRAIYYCQKKEFPFATTSLAGQIIIHLTNNSNKIAITAAPSYTYPFPTKSKKGMFNIGSDTPIWEAPHIWIDNSSSHEPRWYKKLHMMKSITLIIPSKMVLKASQDERPSSALDKLLTLSPQSMFHKSKSCSYIDEVDNNTPGWPVKFK